MIPRKKAWLLILCSILIVSGIAFGTRSYFRHVRAKQFDDPKFRLVALAQASSDGELLKTGYLAELLNLSVDRPVSLLRFNCAEAERTLRANPLIKEAHVAKIKPGTLLVEHQLRKPMAFLGDYRNTAMDSEGHLFPFHPFFTPKKLPEIILGATAFDGMGDIATDPKLLWGQQLKGGRFEMALNIYTHLMHLFRDEPVSIRRIDVSKAYSLSYGQRQVVLIIEERLSQDRDGRIPLITQARVLRLGTANWKQGLARYLVLREFLAKEESKKVLSEGSLVEKAALNIDLRVPRQALFY